MTHRRIAFVEFPPSGGLFQFTVQLGEALAARGHEVDLYTGPRPELSSRHPDFTIHSVLPTWHPMDTRPRGRAVREIRRGLRAGQLAAAWLVLEACLRRARPDVVVFSNIPHSLDALGVLLLARLLPQTMIAIVAHEPRLVRRSDSTAYKRGLVLDRALPAAWRRMGVVFVLADDARTRLLESFEPGGPVLTIPHGDESALRDDDRPVPAVTDTDPVVLFFGTWTMYKGIDVLLDSWQKVRERVPGARLVIAGGVADIDLRATLARAEEVGGVDARPGYVAREEVPDLFGRARVVVVPYVRASQSGVAHLAFTFGRPVVATAVGDIPTVVHDGRTGLLVPSGDPDALADGLVALLDEPQRAQELGENGREWLAKEASWETVAEHVETGIEAGSAAARR